MFSAPFVAIQEAGDYAVKMFVFVHIYVFTHTLLKTTCVYLYIEMLPLRGASFKYEWLKKKCSLVATDLPLYITAKSMPSTHILNILHVCVKPNHLTLLERKPASLECNWRNIVAFSDFYTGGRIKLTIYMKLQCTHKLESFKIYCYAICGTDPVSQTLLLPL